MSTTQSLSLAERMAAVREKHNTSYLSEAIAPISLEEYVRIYNKAGNLGYVDYMEGAKALYKFLSPVCIPHDIIFNQSNAPAIFHGYELIRLAEIVSGQTFGAAYNYVHKCIIYYTAKHILEDVIL
tara:strand:+ start:3229 stop:3606 length:378 start_codon:yes stop_codon:yes gene_type:complete